MSDDVDTLPAAAPATSTRGLWTRVRDYCNEHPSASVREVQDACGGPPQTVQTYVYRVRGTFERMSVDKANPIKVADLLLCLRHSLSCIDTSCDRCVRIEEVLEAHAFGDALTIEKVVEHNVEMNARAHEVTAAVDLRPGPDRDREIRMAAVALRRLLAEGPDLGRLPDDERRRIAALLGAMPAPGGKQTILGIGDAEAVLHKMTALEASVRRVARLTFVNADAANNEPIEDVLGFIEIGHKAMVTLQEKLEREFGAKNGRLELGATVKAYERCKAALVEIALACFAALDRDTAHNREAEVLADDVIHCFNGMRKESAALSIANKELSAELARITEQRNIAQAGAVRAHAPVESERLAEMHEHIAELSLELARARRALTARSA